MADSGVGLYDSGAVAPEHMYSVAGAERHLWVGEAGGSLLGEGLLCAPAPAGGTYAVVDYVVAGAALEGDVHADHGAVAAAHDGGGPLAGDHQRDLLLLYEVGLGERVVLPIGHLAVGGGVVCRIGGGG